MNVFVLPAARLSADHLAAWSHLRGDDPTLASPYFAPQFTQAVDAVRGGVEVAVWEQAGEPVAFLPFQRSGRVGLPVGSPMNDFQGAIARRDVAWSPDDAVRIAGLRSWRFDHLLAGQTAFAPYQYAFAESPYIDLSAGYEAYLKSRTKNFRKNLKRAEQKASRYGDIRLEIGGVDRPAIDQLVEWKIEKCRRTRIPCTFARTWNVNIIHHILANPCEDFSGVLLRLYLGERLAAVELALRSGSILHEWLSAYNVELSDCSPGSMLENRLLQHADSLGITRVDLGKGDEPYKEWIATGYDRLAEGIVHAQRFRAPVYRAWIRAKDRLRATPLRSPVRSMRRWMLSARVAMGFND